jgi:hypothetical protein
MTFKVKGGLQVNYTSVVDANGSWTGNPIATTKGGTGANNIISARENLGLTIGSNVQAYNAILDSISSLGNPGSNNIIYFNGANTVATSIITPFARTLLAGNSASDIRTSLNLGTISTQNSSNVTITGGSITGITPLAITDGGTGANTAPLARTNLGLEIGKDVQAWDETLSALASVNAAADKIAYFTSSNTATDTSLTSYGRSVIASANASALRTTLNLGTISTQDSNNVTITGGSITGITHLAINDGGTGANNAVDARTNLGLVIGTNVLAYDASINSIASATTGYLVKTSNSSVSSREITGGTGVTVTNGNGVSGNTSIAIGQDVSTTSNVTFRNATISGNLNSNYINSANVRIDGDAVVTGNLIVRGSTVTVNSSVIQIGDSYLTLNSLETGTPTMDAGLRIERGTAANVEVLWKESQDRWTFTNDGTNYYNIPIPSEYNNYTYNVSAVSVSSNTAKIRLNGGGTTDDVSIVGTGTVFVTQTDANTITITGTGSTEFEVASITNSSASIVDTFSKLTYRSVEYTFTATVTSGTSHYVTGKILVIHNGTSAYNTQFAILGSNPNDDLVDFTTAVDGNDVKLFAQATTGNVVKVKITGATYSTV